LVLSRHAYSPPIGEPPGTQQTRLLTSRCFQCAQATPTHKPQFRSRFHHPQLEDPSVLRRHAYSQAGASSAHKPRLLTSRNSGADSITPNWGTPRYSADTPTHKPVLPVRTSHAYSQAAIQEQIPSTPIGGPPGIQQTRLLTPNWGTPRYSADTPYHKLVLPVRTILMHGVCFIQPARGRCQDAYLLAWPACSVYSRMVHTSAPTACRQYTISHYSIA
jgi:hypothetical protein